MEEFICGTNIETDLDALCGCGGCVCNGCYGNKENPHYNFGCDAISTMNIAMPPYKSNYEANNQ